MTMNIEFSKRDLTYRFGTQAMVNEQCTADWVRVALRKRARYGVDGGDSVVLRAQNTCLNSANRFAYPNISEVERRLKIETGKTAKVDPSIDGWDGYVAINFKDD